MFDLSEQETHLKKQEVMLEAQKFHEESVMALELFMGLLTNGSYEEAE
jgi:hypothetical protein